MNFFIADSAEQRDKSIRGGLEEAQGVVRPAQTRLSARYFNGA